MTDVRLLDLQFTESETATLLEKVAGQSLDKDAIFLVHQCTEGWIVGLRFAAMGMRYHEDKNRFLVSFCGNINHVQDYLIAEVMAHEDLKIRDCLCRLSILERFCAPLCRAVCGSGANPKSGGPQDDIFDTLLRQSGALAISLDGQRRWFRFHHLFQGLLKQQLTNQLPTDDIAKLHTRAAAWL